MWEVWNIFMILASIFKYWWKLEEPWTILFNLAQNITFIIRFKSLAKFKLQLTHLWPSLLSLGRGMSHKCGQINTLSHSCPHLSVPQPDLICALPLYYGMNDSRDAPFCSWPLFIETGWLLIFYAIVKNFFTAVTTFIFKMPMVLINWLILLHSCLSLLRRTLLIHSSQLVSAHFSLFHT